MATVKEALKGMLLDVNDDTDVIFLVHGIENRAHKCVINARSEVLKALIAEQPVDGGYHINDPQISPEVFKEFLLYLYLDYCHVNVGNLATLLYMSQVYLLPLLKDLCMVFVRDKCEDITDVIKCGEIGLRVEQDFPEILKFVIQALFNNNFESLSVYYTSNGIKTFASKELIERVAKEFYNNDNFSQNDLFREIYLWSLAVCKNKDGSVDDGSMKELLFDILRFINLEKLCDGALLDVIHGRRLLPADQYVHIVVERLKQRTRISELVNSLHGEEVD